MTYVMRDQLYWVEKLCHELVSLPRIDFDAWLALLPHATNEMKRSELIADFLG